MGVYRSLCSMLINRIHNIIFFLAFLSCISPVYAQQTIAELRATLERATSSKAKADACFNLSRKHADALKIDSAFYYAEKVNEFSQKDHYESGFGKYYLAISFASHYRGLISKTKQNASRAIKIFTDLKEYSLLGIAYWQMAVELGIDSAAFSRTNYWTSIYFLKSAGDDHNLFRTYFWLARSFDNTSDYDSAASYYIKSLRLAEQSSEPFKIYAAATDLGRTFLKLRDPAKAYQYLDLGLKNRTPTANKVGLWTSIGAYATCLSILHDFIKADSAIKEFEKLTKHYDEGWGWITLNKIKGIYQYEKGNYPQALDYFRTAYSQVDQARIHEVDVKDVVFGLGKTEYTMQKYDSAIVHLKFAAQLSRSTKSLIDAMEADFLLSELFEKIKMPEYALHYFRKYSHLKDSILSLEKQKMIAEVATRYESEKKEQEIKMLEKEREANSYLLQLRNQQLEKQRLEDEKKSHQLDLALKQNEINKLDAYRKALYLDHEKNENEKKQTRLKLLEKEAAFQKLFASQQNQQRNIAWISVAVILIFGSGLIYRYIRRKQLQNQRDVLNERLRISRELHDEVGSTLSGIAMFSHLTKEQIKANKKDAVDKSLDNIQQSASEMVSKLSDIVWLINPEKDSFQKLFERLEEFASDIARIKNIELILNLQRKPMEEDLPVDKRRNIYLFCKEAITNAIKYSHADFIELTMKEVQNKKICFFIRDNGIGFDPLKVRKGNGLVNMEERAKKMNGQFILETAPGQGTSISLIY
jgi:signal transduction histidine kinase